VRPVLTVSACAMWLVLLAWADVSPVMSQDKPSASKALDPRLESLIGTWEGRVRLATSKSDESRTLIVQEKDGQLGARYGITGKRLDPVDLTVDGGGRATEGELPHGPRQHRQTRTGARLLVDGSLQLDGRRARRRVPGSAHGSREEEVDVAADSATGSDLRDALTAARGADHTTRNSSLRLSARSKVAVSEQPAWRFRQPMR
jgi:hypothetical protein